MAKRKKVPPSVEAEVLIESRRRCCLCFFLRGDPDEKNGQIAHLDHDSSNNEKENLAYLCLEHHDAYDSKSSQSKGLTIQEVKHARQELYSSIKRGFLFAKSGSAAIINLVAGKDLETGQESCSLGEFGAFPIWLSSESPIPIDELHVFFADQEVNDVWKQTEGGQKIERISTRADYNPTLRLDSHRDSHGGLILKVGENVIRSGVVESTKSGYVMSKNRPWALLVANRNSSPWTGFLVITALLTDHRETTSSLHVCNVVPFAQQVELLKEPRTEEEDEAATEEEHTRTATGNPLEDGIDFDWDVFICHASQDKDELVRPLVGKLRSLGFSVWFDESTLAVGDSLRQKIDNGLIQSKFAVVVLSESFFKKDWPQAELGGLLARQRAGRKVVLPLLHKMSHKDLLGYSPMLADLVAISTESGVAAVATKIADAIREATSKGEYDDVAPKEEQVKREQEFAAAVPLTGSTKPLSDAVSNLRFSHRSWPVIAPHDIHKPYLDIRNIPEGIGYIGPNFIQTVATPIPMQLRNMQVQAKFKILSTWHNDKSHWAGISLRTRGISFDGGYLIYYRHSGEMLVRTPDWEVVETRRVDPEQPVTFDIALENSELRVVVNGDNDAAIICSGLRYLDKGYVHFHTFYADIDLYHFAADTTDG